MDDLHTGKGRVKPLDTEEFAEVSVFVNDNIIESACFLCSEDAPLRACLTAVCKVIKDKPAVDLFQMNNNAVYYNLPTPLSRDKLYCASMAVLAAKRAAADWCQKNGIPTPQSDCHCVLP